MENEIADRNAKLKVASDLERGLASSKEGVASLVIDDIGCVGQPSFGNALEQTQVLNLEADISFDGLDC
ncbi:hypothetical protein A2U01_0091060 [Trifolium medium]|uniref:Uncharacterized protein n=1 Tax=Trifolium medium TaxID=97028 RepID=A0A392UAD3_9FABA|nr:hypothetical protein [Trifolium medium]